MSSYYLCGFKADYRNGQWTISQKLTHFSLYRFEGTFDKAINFLLKEQSDFNEDYLNGPCKIRENNCVPELAYKETEVLFERIEIEVGPDDEGTPELQVWGYRKPNQIELVWLEEDRLRKEAEHREYRLQQFNLLREEFSNE